MPFSRRLALLLAVIIVVASVTAPFISWALTCIVGSADRFSFPRVYDRVLEVLAVLALIAARRWLGLTSWSAIGLGRPADRRDLWLGLAIAVGSAAILLGTMYGLGALHLSWRYPFEKGLRKALAGSVAALLIGVGEEILFRGILLGGLMREMRGSAAVAWTTGVYAIVHFLRGGRHAGEVTLTSGFERVGSAFAPLADPSIFPSLVGFVILGLLLAYARLRSGSLYLPIGLHMGWVLVLRVGRLAMRFPSKPGLLWGRGNPAIVSGIAGWAALLVSFAIIAYILRRRSPQGAAGGHITRSVVGQSSS